MKTAWSLITMLLLCANFAHAGKLDPLNPAEQKLSRALSADHHREVHRQKSKHGIASVLRKQALPEYTFLLAERRRTDKNDINIERRLADVYWYDYKTDTLLLNVMDLATQLIVTSSESQGTQLPLTDEELKNAIELLFADSETSARVAQEYKATTNTPLSDHSTQLEIRAFVFHAETASGQLHVESANCGINRCAQLMIYTPDNVAIDSMPIVNLSKQKVTDVLASF